MLRLAATAVLSVPLAAAATDCLPDGSGFLVARLRGEVEADLDWRGASLDCSGMPRPDGRGLRLHFSGTLPDGRPLAFVFAPPRLAEGEDARAVPLNVTVLQGGRIFGTRGDGRCLLDEVSQQRLDDGPDGQREWAVEARGFCTEPARAVDGAGTVLLTRFDFRGRVSYPDEAGDPPPSFDHLREVEVEVGREGAQHRFRAWVAETPEARTRGLMYVRALPPGRGMLFQFEVPHFASFWMKNTYIPLDLLFITPQGRIANIVANATPRSLEPLESIAPVTAVLELAGGTAARLGLRAGDRVEVRPWRDQR